LYIRNVILRTRNDINVHIKLLQSCIGAPIWSTRKQIFFKISRKLFKMQLYSQKTSYSGLQSEFCQLVARERRKKLKPELGAHWAQGQLLIPLRSPTPNPILYYYCCCCCLVYPKETLIDKIHITSYGFCLAGRLYTNDLPCPCCFYTTFTLHFIILHEISTTFFTIKISLNIW